MKICRRCIVNGMVQGVFYRATTQNKANTLRLTGWAKNLPDGSVEVLACGKKDDVDTLCDWLWEGPRSARVTSVACEEVETQDFSSFDTR
jgi:acylphosphatase